MATTNLGKHYIPGINDPEMQGAPIRERLIKFFLRFNPDNVSNVDAISEAYLGDEEQLFLDLEERYDADIRRHRTEMEREELLRKHGDVLSQSVGRARSQEGSQDPQRGTSAESIMEEQKRQAADIAASFVTHLHDDNGAQAAEKNINKKNPWKNYDESVVQRMSNKHKDDDSTANEREETMMPKDDAHGSDPSMMSTDLAASPIVRTGMAADGGVERSINIGSPGVNWGPSRNVAPLQRQLSLEDSQRDQVPAYGGYTGEGPGAPGRGPASPPLKVDGTAAWGGSSRSASQQQLPDGFNAQRGLVHEAAQANVRGNPFAARSGSGSAGHDSHESMMVLDRLDASQHRGGPMLPRPQGGTGGNKLRNMQPPSSAFAKSRAQALAIPKFTSHDYVKQITHDMYGGGVDSSVGAIAANMVKQAEKDAELQQYAWGPTNIDAVDDYQVEMEQRGDYSMVPSRSLLKFGHLPDALAAAEEQHHQRSAAKENNPTTNALRLLMGNNAQGDDLLANIRHDMKSSSKSMPGAFTTTTPSQQHRSPRHGGGGAVSGTYIQAGVEGTPGRGLTVHPRLQHETVVSEVTGEVESLPIEDMSISNNNNNGGMMGKPPLGPSTRSVSATPSEQTVLNKLNGYNGELGEKGEDEDPYRQYHHQHAKTDPFFGRSQKYELKLKEHAQKDLKRHRISKKIDHLDTAIEARNAGGVIDVICTKCGRMAQMTPDGRIIGDHPPHDHTHLLDGGGGGVSKPPQSHGDATQSVAPSIFDRVQQQQQGTGPPPSAVAKPPLAPSSVSESKPQSVTASRCSTPAGAAPASDATWGAPPRSQGASSNHSTPQQLNLNATPQAATQSIFERIEQQRVQQQYVPKDRPDLVLDYGSDHSAATVKSTNNVAQQQHALPPSVFTVSGGTSGGTQPPSQTTTTLEDSSRAPPGMDDGLGATMKPAPPPPVVVAASNAPSNDNDMVIDDSVEENGLAAAAAATNVVGISSKGPQERNPAIASNDSFFGAVVQSEVFENTVGSGSQTSSAIRNSRAAAPADQATVQELNPSQQSSSAITTASSMLPPPLPPGETTGTKNTGGSTIVSGDVFSPTTGRKKSVAFVTTNHKETQGEDAGELGNQRRSSLIVPELGQSVKPPPAAAGNTVQAKAITTNNDDDRDNIITPTTAANNNAVRVEDSVDAFL